MTSKSSFSNILKITLRGRMWTFALACLGLFFSLPVFGALSIAVIKERVASLIIKRGYETALFARDVLGESNTIVMVGVVALGIIMAFNGFSYLYSKSKVDLFHSVPIKRDTLFAAEYVAGIITFIVPYIAFLALTIIVGAVNGMVDGRSIVSACIMLFVNLFGFLFSYNTTILAIEITGHIAVGILGTGVFLLYLPAFDSLISGYQEEFFTTKSYYGNGLILDKIGSIVSLFGDLTDGMSSFNGIYNLRAGKYIQYLIYIVITLVLSIVIFRIRSSESAGKSMAFKKSMSFVEVLLLVPVSLGGAILFELFTGFGFNISFGWYIFGFIASLVIGHVCIQGIYYQDFKSLFKNISNMLIAGGIAAVIAALFIFDLTGYDKYIPKESKVESAAVASYAMQGNVNYYDFEGSKDEYGSPNYARDLLDYRLSNIKITDKELILEIARIGVADSINYKNDTAKGYNSDNDRYSAVEVKYNLKNGGTVNRQYFIDLASHMDLYNKIYTNEDYKKVACPMLSLNDEDVSDIRFSSVFGDEDIRLTDEDMHALVNAYKADVTEQDAFSLRDEVPYGYLYKAVTGSFDGYVEVYNTNMAYVYPSFKRTVSLLEKAGANLDYYRDSSNVNGVEIVDYNNCDESGNSPRHNYTDAKEIEQILENCYPYQLIETEYKLVPTEQYDTVLVFKESPYGPGTRMNYAFKKGQMPEFVMRDLQQ